MLELIPGVNLALLKYTSYPNWDMLESMTEEFRTGGNFPAAAWHLGGYSCFLKEGSVNLSLVVERLDGLSVISFTQADGRVISPGKDKTQEEPCATFAKSVHVSFSGNNAITLRTNKHPQNMIRLLIPSCDGAWRIEEFAIVAQDDRLFLTHQRLYTGFAYRNADGTIVAPAFAHWGDNFTAMLIAAFRECPLPTEDNFRTSEPIIPNVPEGRGIVKYFNLAQQWGSAYIREGNEIVEARLHWGHAHSKRGRIVYFEPGEQIAYGAIAPAKSNNPERQTSFKYELLEVVSSKTVP